MSELIYPKCHECFQNHNPENDCGFYDDYCDERYTLEGRNGNYYIVTFADGSKIYVFRDEFCCSHKSNPNDELGNACESCTKHLFQHIEPIDNLFWNIWYLAKIDWQNEVDSK